MKRQTIKNLLDERVANQLRLAFAEMVAPVEILYFGQQQDRFSWDGAQQLLEELAALGEKLSLSVYDIHESRETAELFGVTHAPGIVVAAKEGEHLVNLGIYYSGLPSGHEVGTLVSDILMASRRDSGLDEATREYLRNLDRPLLLQVFVTPSGPYCPHAVLLAHQMAMENPRLVRAEGVQASEFPDLADRFQLRGFPQTVINSGARNIVGAVPERRLLAEIQSALYR